MGIGGTMSFFLGALSAPIELINFPLCLLSRRKCKYQFSFNTGTHSLKFEGTLSLVCHALLAQSTQLEKNKKWNLFHLHSGVINGVTNRKHIFGFNNKRRIVTRPQLPIFYQQVHGQDTRPQLPILLLKRVTSYPTSLKNMECNKDKSGNRLG